jgi:hypothetical protein
MTTTPLTVTIPHQLGRAEARQRIEAGFAKIGGLLPGSSASHGDRWESDRMAFTLAAMGQSATGAVTVLDSSVTIEIELPGMLGLIAGSLKDRLRKAGQLLLTTKK